MYANFITFGSPLPLLSSGVIIVSKSPPSPNMILPFLMQFIGVSTSWLPSTSSKNAFPFLILIRIFQLSGVMLDFQTAFLVVSFIMVTWRRLGWSFCMLSLEGTGEITTTESRLGISHSPSKYLPWVAFSWKSTDGSSKRISLLNYWTYQLLGMPKNGIRV